MSPLSSNHKLSQTLTKKMSLTNKIASCHAIVDVQNSIFLIILGTSHLFPRSRMNFQSQQRNIMEDCFYLKALKQLKLCLNVPDVCYNFIIIHAIDHHVIHFLMFSLVSYVFIILMVF